MQILETRLNQLNEHQLVLLQTFFLIPSSPGALLYLRELQERSFTSQNFVHFPYNPVEFNGKRQQAVSPAKLKRGLGKLA